MRPARRGCKRNCVSVREIIRSLKELIPSFRVSKKSKCSSTCRLCSKRVSQPQSVGSPSGPNKKSPRRITGGFSIFRSIRRSCLLTAAESYKNMVADGLNLSFCVAVVYVLDGTLRIIRPGRRHACAWKNLLRVLQPKQNPFWTQPGLREVQIRRPFLL